MTTLVGLWLWRARTIRQVWDIPMYVLVPLMAFTVYLCKSKYAILLLITGVAALYGTRMLKTKWAMVAFLCVPLVYTYLRANGTVTVVTVVPGQ